MRSPAPHVPLGYRPHIDGLRAVAVLAVVIYHAFPGALPAGFLGVDVFFVISGFLISQILVADFQSPGTGGGAVIRRFYSRRIRRLFPALLVVLATTVGIGYWVFLPGEVVALAQGCLASVGFCQNLVLAKHTGYFADAAQGQPLLHLWSLGVEEQFYLVWPLVLWLALRLRLRLMPVAVFVATVSFVWNLQKSQLDQEASFFLPQDRFWELMVGAIAGLACLQFRSVGTAGRPGWLRVNALAILGTGLLVASAALLRSSPGMPTAAVALPTIGTACVLAAREDAWVCRHLLGNRCMAGIGLISYPLYLWHWPLLVFARTAIPNGNGPAALLLVLVLALVLAWLTYRFVETPVRRSRPSPVHVGGLVAGMACLAACAWGIKRADGFPGRFPALLQAMSRYDDQHYGAWREGTYFLTNSYLSTGFRNDPAEIDPAKPSLVLWGDSHAAALYPGVAARFGKSYNIVQRTVAGTPPFVRAGGPDAARIPDIEDEILGQIHRIRPAVVMLDANWVGYGWSQLPNTVERLREVGVRRIVVVGPVPQWTGSLFQQVFNHVRLHKDAAIPTRLGEGANPQVPVLDAQLAAYCQRSAIEYVSAYALLHDDSGYLVRIGDTPDSFITWDYGHLTVKGSLYLVAHFPEL